MAFAAIVVVFYVLFGFAHVDGPSMLPNLLEADGLLITKGYDQPRRGDIISLTITGQDGRPDRVVKRVIALPGDTVEVKNDVAYVDGIKESGYETILDAPGRGDTLAPTMIPNGSVYVMGDNRRVSYDSRYIGPQPLAGVEGRIAAIYMPVTRARVLPEVAPMQW